MLSSKSLFLALGLLGLTLPLRAETPNGKLERNNDENRQADTSRDVRERMTIPDEVGGKTFDQWRIDLRSGDPYSRMQAILALTAFGDKAAEVVPTLNKMVQRDGDAGVRAKVLMALKVVKIKPDDEGDTAKTLGYTIGNDSEQSIIRYEAIRTIRRFESVLAKSPDMRQKVVSGLIKELGDNRSCELRKDCIKSLAVVGKDREEGPDSSVSDALLLRTKPRYEPSKQVRLEAIIALGAMGRPHDPRKLDMVKGALRDHLRSKDKDVQIWTHVSLMALEDKIDPEGIDLIVRYLNDDKREIRTHAVTALGAMAKVEALAKKKSEHVKYICTRLEKEDEAMVQEAACYALAHMNDKDPHVLRTLIRLTTKDKQQTNSVVLAACAALTQLGVANSQVMTALKAVRNHRTLSDQEKWTVEECITKLEADASKAGSKSSDKPVAEKTPTGKPARNDNGSPPTNPSRQTKVPPIPEKVGGKTYDEWKADLDHDDPYVRGLAVSTLLFFREKALEAAPTLIAMLNSGKKHDPDAGVRVKIVLALKVMGIRGADRENAIKALAHLISHDSQSIVRFEAVQALNALMAEAQTTADGEAVHLAPKLIDDLIAGAKDQTTCELRQACIMALVASKDMEKGPDPKVTNALIQRTRVLGEPSKQVRMQAIIALGAMGRPHDPAKLKEVLNALHDHYRSTDKPIKIWTHVSLMALGDKINQRDINMIVDYLKDPRSDREVRKQAVTALGAMEKKTTEHVKDICTLLETEEEAMVQEAACHALAHMGDKSPRVLKTLIHLTTQDKQKTNSVVLAACAALAHFHVASPDVVNAMKAVLKHDTLSDMEINMVKGYIKVLESPLPDAPKPKGKGKADKK